MNDWFAHNLLGLPELASSNGQAVDDLMVYVHWLMLVLFVGWIIYFGYVLWRFNAARNPKADYDGSKSHCPSYVELAVVVIEAVLLLGIAVPLWAKNVQQFPKPEDATVIQIMAQQFAWNARYPGLGRKIWPAGHEAHRQRQRLWRGSRRPRRQGRRAGAE